MGGIKWLLFSTSNFGVIYYTAADNQNRINKIVKASLTIFKECNEKEKEN